MPCATPEQQREYQRLWIARRRANWFAANGPCVKCGSWQDLELDHINRAGKVSHWIWSWSKERREGELAKCQALCESCHQEKTTSELRTPIVHGDKSRGYGKGCRCAECMEGMRKWFREYRQRPERIGMRRIIG